MQIERVLVADPVDSVVIDLLTAASVGVDVKTGLSEAQLIQIIPVSVLSIPPPEPLSSQSHCVSLIESS